MAKRKLAAWAVILCLLAAAGCLPPGIHLGGTGVARAAGLSTGRTASPAAAASEEEAGEEPEEEAEEETGEEAEEKAEEEGEEEGAEEGEEELTQPEDTLENDETTPPPPPALALPPDLAYNYPCLLSESH